MTDARIAIIAGEPFLIIDADPEPSSSEGPTDAGTHHLIPLAAIASWSALLGTADDEETIAAILHVRENGEPEPDPETGRNAWTPAYEQLEMERAASDATAAAEKAESAESIAAAFALSRSRARASGALTGRAETRSLLGLPAEPVTEATPMAASLAGDGAQQVRGISLSSASVAAVSAALGAVSGDAEQKAILDARERFLESIA